MRHTDFAGNLDPSFDLANRLGQQTSKWNAFKHENECNSIPSQVEDGLNVQFNLSISHKPTLRRGGPHIIVRRKNIQRVCMKVDDDEPTGPSEA
jgi:hypothetical protein